MIEGIIVTNINGIQKKYKVNTIGDLIRIQNKQAVDYKAKRVKGILGLQNPVKGHKDIFQLMKGHKHPQNINNLMHQLGCDKRYLPKPIAKPTENAQEQFENEMVKALMALEKKVKDISNNVQIIHEEMNRSRMR